MDVDGYTVWVVGGSLLVVAAQVPERQRQQAFAALFRAQQQADDSAGSRFEGGRLWFGAYRRALSHQGWSVSHSSQSVERGECRSLSPLQPLLLWLSCVHPEQADILERCVAALSPDQKALGQLSRQAARVTGSRGRLVVELGLLQPGPALSLCHIALELSESLAPGWLFSVLPGASIRGDVHFQGLVLETRHELLGSAQGASLERTVSRTLH